MSKSSTRTKLRTYVGWFLLGFGAPTLVVVILVVLAAIATADESTRTYPARLGEQDRSLNYKYTDSSGMEFEHVIILDQDVGPLRDPQCERTNAYLLFVMKDIAARIAKDPNIGYLYETTLLTIRGAWCYE